MVLHRQMRRAPHLKRLFQATVFVLLCYLIVHTNGAFSRGTTSTILQDVLQDFPGRKSLLISPFSRFSPKSKLASLFVSPQSVDKWKRMALSERCRYYFDTTYAFDNTWTNDYIRTFYASDSIDNPSISMAVERLRVFDDCFGKGGLSLNEVLGNKDTADFQHRMFPFLRKFNDLEEMWPEITDLNTREILTRGDNPVFSSESNKFTVDKSLSLWQNWAQFSYGKGLVFTLGERHKAIFLRLLKILDHLDNRLPIQIVQKGEELSSEFIEAVSEFLKSSKQKVYVVNCSNLLNPLYQETDLTYFVNKWLAVVFNTFDEVISLDADVVPFIPLSSFFEDQQYKNTGALMYKDRNMLNEHTFDYCIEMFNFLEPSSEASRLMGHSMKINSSVVKQSTQTFKNEEEKVYHRFFYDKILHNVDSGLVVMNKKEKLSSLVLSFMLNLDAKVKRCVYGDKEIFWLGQLISGEDYSIDPRDGSAVGSIESISTEDKTVKEYSICATQIGHSDGNGMLLWTNGGLKTCKVENAALDDFEHIPEYYQSKYGSVEDLQSIYDKPLKIDGFIIPDVFVQPWVRKDECRGYMYCAPALQKTTDPTQDGKNFVTFDEETSQRLNQISILWNEDL